MAKSRYEYVNFLNWLFLTFIRTWANIGRFFFYRRFRTIGKKNIHMDKPVMFCVNHQNAFLDPMIIGMTSGRKPWYITQAGVFSGKFVKYILHSIHMLPIYRLRDKVNIRTANEATFKKCEDVLSGRGSVLIFPEGNHGIRKFLRKPLKKGFARIALNAEARNNFELGLEIIPTGLYYEHPTKFRSDAMVYYGRPFTITHLKEVFLRNENEAQKQLTAELEAAMPEFMIDIRPFGRYEEIERKWMANRPKERNLEKRFNSDKAIVQRLMNNEEVEYYPEKKMNGLVKALLLIVGAPVFLWGFLNNFPLYFTTRKLIGKIMKDPHYNQSFLFVLGIAGVPVFMLLQSFIVYFIFSSWTACWTYFFTTPLFGILAYDFYDLLIRKPAYFNVGRAMDQHPLGHRIYNFDRES